MVCSYVFPQSVCSYVFPQSALVSVKFSKWHHQLSENAQRVYKDPRFNDLDNDTKRQVRLLSQDASPKSDNDVR